MDKTKRTLILKKTPLEEITAFLRVSKKMELCSDEVFEEVLSELRRRDSTHELLDDTSGERDEGKEDTEENRRDDLKLTLYRLTSNSRIMVWSIWIEDKGSKYIIYTEHGQVNGKISTDKGKIVSKGKAGRSLYEQTLSQYNSMVNKKRDNGYTENENGVNKDLPILPMLAQNYEKHKNKIKFPALAQPKLDGVRCTARTLNKQITLLSRKGKPFENLDQITSVLHKVKLSKSIVLDGELFSDELDFQRVVGLVRKKTLSEKDKEDMNKVKLNVFDLIHLDKRDMSFEERWKLAKKIVRKDKTKTLQLVNIYPIDNVGDINRLLTDFLENGDEGIMIRNKESPYEIDKRSFHLQKYKKFVDAEYEIVDAMEGTGNDKGTVIWVCKTSNDQRFRVRPVGTRESRIKMFDNKEKYIGKLLTVKYQELTNDGIPRFPVGITVRDYE